MERTKYFIIIIFILLTSFNTSSSSSESIYNSYTNSNMAQWKNTIDRIEEINNKSNASILELVNYQYGYIAWCLGNNRSSEAREYLEKARRNLEILEENNYELSMVEAYKAAFYGFRINLNNFNAPILGPRSINSANKAIEINNRNWMAYIQKGNIQFYMPAAFGGSKSKAIEYYRKAQSIMENEEKLTINNWNYLNLLVIIAQAYEDTGYYTNAKSYYHKALRAEPGFKWVKDDLLPKLK